MLRYGDLNLFLPVRPFIQLIMLDNGGNSNRSGRRRLSNGNGAKTTLDRFCSSLNRHHESRRRTNFEDPTITLESRCVRLSVYPERMDYFHHTMNTNHIMCFICLQHASSVQYSFGHAVPYHHTYINAKLRHLARDIGTVVRLIRQKNVVMDRRLIRFTMVRPRKWHKNKQKSKFYESYTKKTQKGSYICFFGTN